MAKVFADDVALNYTGTDPYLTFITSTVYDAGGNNNGHLDPGETVDVTATLKNIGGVDFTNLSTTIECSDPNIIISDNAGYFGYLAVDSTKENVSDPYVITASPSTPQGYEVEIRLVATEGAFVDTLYFTIVVGFYDYLIWNPDPTPSSGQTIHNILSSLGYNGNLSPDLPAADNLDSYWSIFTCVGISPYKYIIDSLSSDASALVNYLNSGGSMYLEGGDVWYYDPLVGGYEFGLLFGINPVADGSGNMGPVVGELGTFTNSMNFGYAGENNYMDHINSISPAFVIFHDEDNSYNCGVANDAGAYKTVGTSFELGGLVDGTGVSTKAALLDSIMHFFGIFSTGVEEITKFDVKIPRLKLYPNPFSKLININFGKVHPDRITHSSNGTGGAKGIELKIYDATGRLVRSFPIINLCNPNKSVVSVYWDGTDDTGRLVPAGVYFIHYNIGKDSNYPEVEKVILVR